MIITVFEDNAGGIHFVEDYKKAYYQGCPERGKLLEDLINFTLWNDDCEPSACDAYTYDGVGYDKIAECDLVTGSIKVYPDKFGSSGKLYAGITE